MFTERVEIRPRYVHVLCGGTLEIEGFLRALDRAFDTAHEAHRKAVVMDALGVEGSLTQVERFVLGEDIAYAQRAHCFVAMVAVVANEPPLDADRLAEKVAINRGAVGKSFTQLADAERWIEERVAVFAAGSSPDQL